MANAWALDKETKTEHLLYQKHRDRSMPFSFLYSITHAFRVQLDICIIILKVALLYTTGTYLTTDLWQDPKRCWLKQWLQIECLLIYILLPGWFFSPLVPFLSSLYNIFLWNLGVLRFSLNGNLLAASKTPIYLSAMICSSPKVNIRLIFCIPQVVACWLSVLSSKFIA